MISAFTILEWGSKIGFWYADRLWSCCLRSLCGVDLKASPLTLIHTKCFVSSNNSFLSWVLFMFATNASSGRTVTLCHNSGLVIQYLQRKQKYEIPERDNSTNLPQCRQIKKAHEPIKIKFSQTVSNNPKQLKIHDAKNQRYPVAKSRTIAFNLHQTFC